MSRLTADDLLGMPDEDNFELIDGELRELRRTMESSWIGGAFLRKLGDCVDARKLGWIFGGGLGIRCFPHDTERVRRPNVSVYLLERLPRLSSEPEYTRISPDLVVEVATAYDTADDVDCRVSDWLAADVDEIWDVLPSSQTVTLHRPSESARMYRADDELESNVIPGFRCRVGDLFPVVTDDSE